MSPDKQRGLDEGVFCPTGKKICRHASDECLRNVQRVGVIKTGTLERRETCVQLGVRCNNHGNAMASDLDHCPQNDISPVTQLEDDPLLWASRRGI